VFTVVGTDATSLSVARNYTDALDFMEPETGFLVPMNALSVIRVHLERTDLVELGVTEKTLVLKCAETDSEMIFSLSDGPYPCWRKLIGFDLDTVIPIYIQELLEAVQMVVVVGKIGFVELNFTKDTLTVVGENPCVGHSEVKMRVPYSGRDLTMSFPLYNLLSLLHSFTGPEVRLGYAKGGIGVLFTDEGMPGYESVLALCVENKDGSPNKGAMKKTPSEGGVKKPAGPK
jgi:DNA polymerase III sliding clamp (beta) subunit (PCNA family)